MSLKPTPQRVVPPVGDMNCDYYYYLCFLGPVTHSISVQFK